MAKRTKPTGKRKARPPAKPKAKRKPIKPTIKDRRTPISPVGRELLDALDHMQDLAPNGTKMWVRNAPPNVSRTPWLIVARFGMPGGTTYDQTFLMLYKWRDNKTIERLIKPQRLARIQVRYITSRGKEGEYTIAEIGPWEMAISRAVERVGFRDGDNDSLIERYGENADQSDIDAIIVWFSAKMARQVVGIPTYSVKRHEIEGGGEEADERVPEQTPVYEQSIGFGRIGVDAPPEAEEQIVELPWGEPIEEYRPMARDVDRGDLLNPKKPKRIKMRRKR